MIIFHEGLPRSGKSYEAVVKHILPALKKGRRVVGYIEGLDHAKIASVIDEPEERVRALLHPVAREAVAEICQWAENNALIVVDEVQNFWPTSRDALSGDVTQLVAEHGRRGMDIVLMGQCFADVHPIWRRRTSMRIEFMKREAIGRAGEYTWRMYKATAPEKFVHMASGGGKYEQRYWECYSSYDPNATQLETYSDDRAVVWNHKGIKFGLPAFAVLLAVAGYGIWDFFGGGFASETAAKVPTPPVRADLPFGANVRVEAPRPVPVAAPVVPAPAVVAEVPKREGWLGGLIDRTRPRVAGVIRAGDRVAGVVEFYIADRMIERLDFDSVRAMGWAVEVRPYGVDLVRGDDRVEVTAWPLANAYAEVSAQTRQSVREAGRGGASATSAGADAAAPADARTGTQGAPWGGIPARGAWGGVGARDTWGGIPAAG